MEETQVQVALAPPETTEKLSKLRMLHIREPSLQEDARKLNCLVYISLVFHDLSFIAPAHQKICNNHQNYIVIINKTAQTVQIDLSL